MSTAPDSLMSRLDALLREAGQKAARTPFRLFFFACVALACTWPLLRTAGAFNAYRDWLPYEETARRTVVEYGQLPLWDPYYCGGLDLLGTPQSRYVSPTFLLSLLVGTLRAEALVPFVMILLGLEGTYRYARSRAASHLGATLAAPIYAASGLFAFSPALTWTNFFGFELVPWAVLGVRRAMRGSLAGVAITAVAFAWMMGFGGTYSVPFAALFCAFEIIDGLIVLRSARALKLVALAVVLAGALSAVRLWPLLQTMSMAPRIVGGAQGIASKDLLPALFGQIHPDSGGDFDIRGNYLVGGMCLAAVFAGLLRRRSASLVIAGAAAIWLAQGFSVPVSLFALLKRLPLYSALRYPERFLVLLALATAVVAALGITQLQVIARRRRWGVAVLGIAAGLLLVNLQPLVKNHHASANGRMLAPPPVHVDQPFRQARGTRWGVAYYGPMGLGCLSCYDAYPVPQSPLLRGDLEAEEYLEEPNAGTVTRTRWTPGAIWLHVEMRKPGRVLVNQNWHPGWRSSVGTVQSAQGLLSVDVPAGTSDVVLRFLPRAALGGAAISLTALGVLGWLVWRVRRRRTGLSTREYAGALVLPIVPFALTLAVVREPSAPSVPLKTVTGESILADAPPADARRIDAQFAGGVTLEAFKMTPTTPAAESVVTMEFDWKVAPDVESKMGFFVHLVPSSGNDLRADHVMVSDALEIEKAPPGKTLRDIMQMSVPYDAGGKTWKVYAGLWRVRGDGKRIPVIRTGTATVSDNRLDLGSFTVP
ncbi:hypothetical protein LVJ94_04440 [Pendulispora rubella]|uniref:Mannosyltransferase n=1 Tax=Pendulispora rubella TaxID=2741070 RepID=A0ABZ2LCL9_9BACT